MKPTTRTARRGLSALALTCAAVVIPTTALAASLAVVGRPQESVAPHCTAWARTGKRPPQRVGAVWPARCWLLDRGLDATSSGWRTLSEGPPAVWWGWTEAGEAKDSIHYSDMRLRVRHADARTKFFC